MQRIISFLIGVFVISTVGATDPLPNSNAPQNLAQIPQTNRSGTPITGAFMEDPKLRSRAMAIPEVKNIFTMCQSESRSKNPKATVQEMELMIDNCFNLKFQQLPPMQAKQLILKLDSQNLYQQSNLKYKKNPAYIGLQEYLSKRLRESLYGDYSATDPNAPTQTKVVDHEVFYQLFKSQLGKNILTIMSDYCIEAGPNGIISADQAARDSQRESNIQLLTQVQAPKQDQNQEAQNLNQAPGAMQAGPTNQGYTHFAGCIARITHICNGTKYYNIDYSNLESMVGGNNNQSADGNQGKDKTVKNAAYARNRACAVNAQLKDIREQMLALRKIETKLNERKQQSANQGTKLQTSFAGIKDIYGSKNDPKEKNIDELTSITSGELIKDSGLGKTMMQNAVRFQRECVKQMGPNCMNLANNNIDYQNFIKLKNEYNARTNIAAGKIRSMNMQELQEFLRQEGRTQPEIQMILQKAQQTGQGKQIQQTIAEQYARERQAVIKRLNANVEKNNMQMGQKNPYTSPGAVMPRDPQEAMDFRQKIADRLMKKAERIRDVFHFNNIVSGYLQTIGQNGARTQNTGVALRELKNSAFSPGVMAQLQNQLGGATMGASTGEAQQQGQPGQQRKMPFQVDPKYYQQLQAATSRSLRPAPEGSQKGDQTSFEVETLNRAVLGNYFDMDQQTQRQMNNLKNQDLNNRMNTQNQNTDTASQPPPPEPVPASP